MNHRPQLANGVAVPYDVPVSELRTHLRPPGPLAWAACIALGQHPGRDAFALLVDLADSPDWRYRRAAVEALAGHQLGREAAALLGKRLGDPSPYVVRTACRAVALLGLHSLHDAVAVLLRAREAPTRTEALAALATLWQPTDFEPVFVCLRLDPSAEVRKRAAWTLRTNASAASWRRLFDTWRRDPLPRHRTWAAELAAALGGREVEPPLQELLEDPNGHVRKAAQDALRQIDAAHRVPTARPTGAA